MVLTYRAVKDLAGVASIFLENVVLRVLNSEPVDISKEDIRKTAIHTVEKINNPGPEPFTIEKDKRLLRLEGRCLRGGSNDERKIGEEIKEEENEVLKLAGVKDLDEVAVFALSIENGYPLLALTTMPQNIDLERIANSLREAFHKFIRFEIGNNEIKVRYLARYTANTSSFIKSLMIAEIIEKDLKIQRSGEASLKVIEGIDDLL
ncbi:MAG: hypothetical protein QXQ57_03640 [Sulfolobales archaeon]